MSSHERPIVITIVCVVLVVAVIIGALGLGLAIATASYTPGRLIWIAITNVAAFISVIGLWKMKRWGVYLYLLEYSVATGVFYLWPPPEAETMSNPFVVAGLPVVYCAFVLPYWKRLLPNHSFNGDVAEATHR